MTDWTGVGTFQVNKQWYFSSPITSNVIKFKSRISGQVAPINDYLTAKGLLTLARFENDSLSNPLFLYPSEIIYPWIPEPQLVIFPQLVLPGTYRIATKVSSGNLGSNVWSLDVWEYTDSISTPNTLSSESLTAIQQLLSENSSNPVSLTPEAISQIAEAVNQPQTIYYPPP